jgi:hypothetical protein
MHSLCDVLKPAAAVYIFDLNSYDYDISVRHREATRRLATVLKRLSIVASEGTFKDVPFILLFNKVGKLSRDVRSCYVRIESDHNTRTELQDVFIVLENVARRFEDALQRPVTQCIWDDRHDVSLLPVFKAMGEACGVGTPATKTKPDALQTGVEESSVLGVKLHAGNASPPSEI